MSDAALRIFRSDFKVIMRMSVKVALYVGLLLLAATVIRLLMGNRFPNSFELFIVLLMALATYAVLGLLFYIAVIAFPVKVLAHGLRAYNSYGRYFTVEWAHIDRVGLMNVGGLPYLSIHSSKLKQEITLPLWLENMPEFIQLVEQQAGSHHQLVRALREATPSSR
jgi:hypothetical protein